MTEWEKILQAQATFFVNDFFLLRHAVRLLLTSLLAKKVFFDLAKRGEGAERLRLVVHTHTHNTTA